MSLTRRLHDLGVAEQEGDTPSRHREALGHRVQLDGALLGALGLEDARRPIAVEPDVGVGEVVNDDHLPLATEVDDALHEVELDAGAGGVVWEGCDEHARLRPTDVVGGGQAVEELLGERASLVGMSE